MVLLNREEKAMLRHVEKYGLKLDAAFVEFVETELLQGLNLELDQWLQSLAALVNKFEPRRSKLLAKRDKMQKDIDEWARHRRDQDFDVDAYEAMLRSIGWLEPDVADFSIDTDRIDPEIGVLPGPQLVVPVSNARYAINAANARWGSLYDALYSTDAIPGKAVQGGYDQSRGAEVIAWGRKFLDDATPLASGSHANVKKYTIKDGKLDADGTGLLDPEKLIGWRGLAEAPEALLLCNNGLHIEIVIDPSHPVAQADMAGVRDILLEAALSVIMDAEDSVAAVDAEDKIGVYRNWLGLMRGNLSVEFTRGSQKVERTLNSPRCYTGPEGSKIQLRALALSLVRNVGELMTTPTVLESSGSEISESMLDAMVTVTAALHDLARPAERRSGSAYGSIYIVKPKLQGPEEVAYVNDLFMAVEDYLGLEPYTIKIGLMDEEKRTSANLKSCIKAIKHRIFFINTGFLDRTGNEIFNLMEFGPIIPKQDIKHSVWLKAYENRNVEIGLECGLHGKAQIGKGMWAAPDQMAEMLVQKSADLKAAANTAWVPSPTAAILHATHYHHIDVLKEQKKRLEKPCKTSLSDLLTPPLADGHNWSGEEIQSHLNNSVQGLLGYTVRWVNQGIGCSKVPDINNVGLMEDRATLRISSQQIANWLHHGIVTRDQVIETLRKTAGIVDAQNANDSSYEPLVGDFEGPAFKASLELALEGWSQPSGYTEPVLHRCRQARKTANAS